MTAFSVTSIQERISWGRPRRRETFENFNQHLIVLILFPHLMEAWRNFITQSVSGRAQARTQSLGVLLHVCRDGPLWVAWLVSPTSSGSTMGESWELVLFTTIFTAPWRYTLGDQWWSNTIFFLFLVFLVYSFYHHSSDSENALWETKREEL